MTARDRAAVADTLLVTVLRLARVPQAELARRSSLSTKHVNQLCKGLVPMSIDVALRLEQQLGIPAELWMHADTLVQIAAQRAAAEQQRLHAAQCGPERGGFRVCYCTGPCCHPIRDGRRVCVCPGCRATPESAGNRKDQT